MKLFLFIAVFLLSFAAKSDDNATRSLNLLSQNRTKESVTKPNTKTKASYKIYGEYKDIALNVWKVAVIQEGLSKEELISVAREIFREHGYTRFELFDNAEKIKEYIFLEKSLVDSSINFKEDSIDKEWINKHRIANINDRSEKSRDTNSWQLTSSPYNQHIAYFDE